MSRTVSLTESVMGVVAADPAPPLDTRDAPAILGRGLRRVAWVSSVGRGDDPEGRIKEPEYDDDHLPRPRGPRRTRRTDAGRRDDLLPHVLARAPGLEAHQAGRHDRHQDDRLGGTGREGRQAERAVQPA